MIYYFNAIKSLVDTKAKNSLTSYPERAICAAAAARPSLPFTPLKKGILILLTELVEGNNGKDKNSNYYSPPPRTPLSLAKLCLYDRLYDK